MKLKNSTEYPDHFLRRMIAWICRELDMPFRQFQAVSFGNRAKTFSGRYQYARNAVATSISISPELSYPYSDARHKFNDRHDCFVAWTAEVLYAAHCGANGESVGVIRNRLGQKKGRQALAAYRENYLALLITWYAAPKAKPTKTKPNIIEQRAAKTAEDLQRWQRKLKLAQTKVRKLKQRANYYQAKRAQAEQP